MENRIQVEGCQGCSNIISKPLCQLILGIESQHSCRTQLLMFEIVRLLQSQGFFQ